MKSIEEMRKVSHMEYMEDMEQIPSDIMDKVINEIENTNFDIYTKEDVIRALNKDEKSIEDFKALLSPEALPFLEDMAKAATKETRKHFGNSIYLFTPLYISNYCENYCIYCGFNCYNKIKRAKLPYEDIEKEMEAISKTGIEEILILTGESRKMSDVEYIGKACEIAKKYFKNVGIEVYPMNSDEYKYLHEHGADFVTVFQETYNSDKYETLHLMGHKRIFPYRFNAQERALMGGMRGVAFAALLGLDDFRKDALATGLHAYYLQRKYPHAEISFSCPRLRPIINNDKINPKDVHEPQLLQVMCAYRLFMPFAGLTISTRERAGFRDNVLGMCATKISAGVSTGIGSHTDEVEEEGDDQFEISDARTLDEVLDAIKNRGLQPVMNDYVYLS
ncbi:MULTISPECIES: 2-iminoacetate synthase ThiH [Anaerofustis]|uniref:2-iminoacetate synthase ThiH n=1 Tax=Anaerofustis TaxID=264995 RepID=UPI001105E821|nr:MULTISPECIES: 2-iminoacetate synthase ThiH [Anaerofustis]MCO8194493.1 2-iminoacetate synthase ThiH [Anaerofustis sp. NSJ-163]